MKTKTVWLAVMMLLLTICMKAQTFNGRVVDEYSAPVGYATVALLLEADSTCVQGCITNDDGTFLVDAPEDRPYLLQVSFIGYVPFSKRVSPGDVGTVVLHASEVTLNTVVVTGHLPVYKPVDGGIATHVENSVLSKVGTASNVITHIPGVKKKQNGDFEVLGKGVPLIYIDNKLVRDLSELDRLNSADVRQVELITNPGAKYDASVGAVLRLRTVRKEEEGLSLGLRSAADYSYKMEVNEQLDIAYRHKGLDLFGAFRYQMMRHRETAETVQTTYVDTLWLQSTQSKDVGKWHTYSGQLGFNYVVNEQHSFGMTYELTAMPLCWMTNYNRTDVYADANFYDTWHTYDYSREKTYPTHHSNLYYNGMVRKLNIDFNADVLSGRSDESEDVYEMSRNYEDYKNGTYSETRNRLYAGKLILSGMLWGGTLAGGSEYSLTKRNSDFSGSGTIIHSSADRIKEQNLAFFLDYRRSFGKVNAIAGLRYEYVDYNFYENGIYQSDASKNYRNCFPSVSLDAVLGEMNWMLNYAVQTIRPHYEMLKNSTHYGNRFTYLSGTPDLQPTYIHSVELKSLYRDFQFSVGYSHYKDDILFAVEQYQNDSKIAINKFRNVDSRDELVVSAAFSPGIGIWHPEWFVSGQTQWFETPFLDRQRKMNGTVFLLQWHNSFKLPSGIIFRLDGDFATKGNRQNKQLGSTGCVNASLYKEFLHGKLDLLLEGDDLLHTMRDASTQFDLKTMQYRATKDNTRLVRLTIRCNINNFKSKYKGTGAGQGELHRL